LVLAKRSDRFVPSKKSEIVRNANPADFRQTSFISYNLNRYSDLLPTADLPRPRKWLRSSISTSRAGNRRTTICAILSLRSRRHSFSPMWSEAERGVRRIKDRACETRGICRMLRKLGSLGGWHHTFARVTKAVACASHTSKRGSTVTSGRSQIRRNQRVSG
jgi:hypothetical protein